MKIKKIKIKAKKINLKINKKFQALRDIKL